MKRITKAQATTQRVDHAKAVAEGRVLRVEFSFMVYPTTEARDAAFDAFASDGFDAFKVPSIPSPYEVSK